jgi:hypothetical protein
MVRNSSILSSAISASTMIEKGLDMLRDVFENDNAFVVGLVVVMVVEELSRDEDDDTTLLLVLVKAEAERNKIKQDEVDSNFMLYDRPEERGGRGRMSESLSVVKIAIRYCESKIVYVCKLTRISMVPD